MPRFRRKDANHKDVQQHLERNGCEVIDCSGIGGIVDLLVYHPSKGACFIEVKIPGSRAAFTKVQLKWISTTIWPVSIVKDKESALDFVMTGRGRLTDSEKHRLGVLAATTTAEQVRPDAVERILNT